MNPPDELARHRIQLAQAALNEADRLIQRQYLRGALNRIYYAAFYAARALLATRGLDSSRHSGVIALFQEHFVRTGLVSTENARVLPRAFEKRQTSDYGDFSEPSGEEVLAFRDQVGALVQSCGKILTSSAESAS